MKSFRLTKILLIAVIVLGGAYLLSPEYLRNAAFYLYPGIDDHKHFDNRTVIAGAPDPWQSLDGSGRREVPPGYEELLEKYKTVSFLVVEKGQIIFERYWEGYTQESLTGTFSVSKSIISFLTGIAIDRGFIDSVDQALGDFIPEFSTGGLAKITLRHLLEMSSGLSWDDSYLNPFGITSRAYYGDNLRELSLKQNPVELPGEFFRYKNGNTQLLAIALEKACGMSVSAFASANLWKKTGAVNDALWSLDKVNGIEKAFAGFNATARDLARIGQLILNRGEWRGRQVISSGYIESALAPSSHLTDKNGNKVNYYGWHWWMHRQDGMIIYSMRGLKGQYVIVIPDRDIVIVRLGKKAGRDLDNSFTPSDLPGWVNIGLYLAADN